MAWNEPGKGRDPWGGGNGQGGPPDLDEIVRKMQQRMRGLFGRGGGGKRFGGGGRLIWLYAGLAVAAWLATGFYKVDAPEQGIVLRFGEYARTAQPGLRWHLPAPVERVEKVNITAIGSFKYQEQMLTADENIVYVEMDVQYRRDDAPAYLFNVRDADGTLQDVAQSAIREIVGTNRADYILSEGRTAIADLAEDLMRDTLKSYGAGISVTQVNLVRAQPPPEVQDAVDDATKAREDKERLRLEAEAYANEIVPRARGQAAREIQEAEAYRDRVVADAEGEAARFEALLAEYEKAPGVTRQRLYLETIEAVYGANSKVLLDAEGGGNLIYLPMDKLIEQQQQRRAASESGRSLSSSQVPAGSESAARRRNDLRSRGSR